MANWTIVALPSKEDYVNKISSEKVPHLTLLFLGEQNENPKEREVASFLLHVANTSMTRFGMTVDRRGILGPKDADVLFFGDMNKDKLETLRNNLLANPAISEAYDSTEQFPEWHPHLTLGYPETPAKEDDRDYPGVGWVNFDRLAFWTGDSAGYEIPLNPEESMLHKFKPSTPEESLTHYGIPGMRWGKRKSVSLSKPSSDHLEVKQLKQKKASELTNAELQKINNRKQLEKKYKDLNPSTVNRGHQAVKGVLAIAGTAAAVAALASNPVVQKGSVAVFRAISGAPGRHAANAVVKTAARHLA